MAEESGFDSWQGQEASLDSVQTGYGAHLVPHTIGTGSSYLRSKATGVDTGHSPPSSAEVNNGGAIPPLTHVFILWRLIN
jgi:hypothetical protein